MERIAGVLLAGLILAAPAVWAEIPAAERTVPGLFADVSKVVVGFLAGDGLPAGGGDGATASSASVGGGEGGGSANASGSGGDLGPGLDPDG